MFNFLFGEKRKEKRHSSLFTEEQATAQGSFIQKIELVSKRPFYDTVWNILTSDGPVTITRFDDDTFADIQRLLSHAHCIEDVKWLDRKDVIWYD